MTTTWSAPRSKLRLRLNWKRAAFQRIWQVSRLLRAGCAKTKAARAERHGEPAPLGAFEGVRAFAPDPAVVAALSWHGGRFPERAIALMEHGLARNSIWPAYRRPLIRHLADLAAGRAAFGLFGSFMDDGIV